MRRPKWGELAVLLAFQLDENIQLQKLGGPPGAQKLPEAPTDVPRLEPGDTVEEDAQ